MDNLLLTLSLLPLTLYLLARHLHLRRSHPAEPPIIPSLLPFLGPLLGMALQGGRYLKHLGLAHPNLPIFTLPVPLSRLYIVTSPHLAAAVQRASRSLSFSPLVPDITRRVLGLDDAAVEILRDGVDEEGGFLGEIREVVGGYLGHGERLEGLSLAAAGELAGQVGEYMRDHLEGLEDGGRGREEDLLVWIRRFVARGTGRLLYGQRNPFVLSEELEDAFWDFDHGLGGLLTGALPWLTARRAYKGREKLMAAFEKWIRAGSHQRDDVPDIIKERIRVAQMHGFTTQAVARSEVSFLFAGIVNTATTTFWTVLHLFAARELLAEVRTEVERCVEAKEERKEVRLALERLKMACPTLLAVVRECLRLGSDNYSVRLVQTDTELVGGQYLLKAGSVVQIAGGVMHADRRIWGDNVNELDHTRFLKVQQADGSDEGHVGTQRDDRSQVQQTSPTGVHPAAFRAFGGGKTLCPGRHFAINEILAFVAVIVLTFEIEAADGSGRIRIPKKNDGVLPVHILEPLEPVKVRVRLRKDAPMVHIV